MRNSQLLIVLLSSGLLGVWAGVQPHQLLHRTPGPVNLRESKGLGIYDGNTTYIEDHPYLVSVTYIAVLFCAGTIIGRNWVLLSADCLNGYETNLLLVIAGSRDGQRGTQNYDVLQAVVHPDYDYASHTNNYALLEIKGNFTWSHKVKKAKLPTHSAKAGTWLTITGYGESDANAVLQEGKMQVLSKKECYKLYEGYTLNLTNTVGCVYNKGKTTICTHDSADPLVRDGVLYHFTTAISDSGYCSSSAMPTITSDVYGAVPWIKEVTGIQ